MTESLRICVIPGDGIGREVIPAALEVLQATGLPVAIEAAEAGWECFQRTGSALPGTTLAAAQAADAVLFGAVASPSYPVAGYRSPIVALRRELDLYANIRPVRGQGDQGGHAYPPVRAAQPDAIDMVVVRENTEGLYAGRERVEDAGNTAITERVITRRASERIIRAAFELARKRSNLRQPHVMIVHKANVLRETCGLFRRVALEVAQEFADVAYDELLVDTCALQLIQRPEAFNVVVTTNLFGDILSDVASYWGGGLGLATSANLGEHAMLFEPVHGAAPDIAGKGSANPLAAIGCIALMLRYQAQRNTHTPDQQQCYATWAQRIETAMTTVISQGPHTPDLGGAASTREVTQAVVEAIQACEHVSM
jgi:homoisocitrate dehydrogenase